MVILSLCLMASAQLTFSASNDVLKTLRMFIQLKIMHLQTILTVLFLIATEKCERPSSLCIAFGRPLFYSTIVYRVGL